MTVIGPHDPVTGVDRADGTAVEPQAPHLHAREPDDLVAGTDRHEGGKLVVRPGVIQEQAFEHPPIERPGAHVRAQEREDVGDVGTLEGTNVGHGRTVGVPIAGPS